ncbi:MAG: restriction endonuclease subunit S [Gemmiger sp.]|nr:restriction endonuclease subunit S [Gemmiger sp.]
MDNLLLCRKYAYNLHYEKFQDGSVKCIEEEIPFEVPEGWEWCRLRELFNVCSSKRVLQSEWKTEGVPFYRAREIAKLANTDYVDNDLFISQKHYHMLMQTYDVPHAGDLMVTGVGTIGKVYIVKEKDCFYYKDASVLCFENCYHAIEPQFAKFMIDSSLLQKQIHSKTYGNTVDTITIAIANDYLCVLPPLSEQTRIISKLQDSLQMVSSIKCSSDKIETSIRMTKSKILDLAIRGKLVPQDSADEPASVLLERIRAEKEELIKQGKIKRDKNDSIIYKGDDNSYYEKFSNGSIICIDEDIPFDIPNSWQWVRLNNLVVKDVKRGKAPKYSEDVTNTLVFAQKCNLKAGGINTELAKYLDEAVLSKYLETDFLTSGDIVVNSTGTGTLGRVGILEDILISIVPDTHVTVIRTSPHICSRYIYCVLKESQPVLEDSGEGSTNQKELRPNTLTSFLVPLPPLDEQIRIASIITKANKVLLQITKKIS